MCDCKTDWLRVPSPLEVMKYFFKLKYKFSFLRCGARQSAALISVTQHAMPPEFGRKWGTECLTTLLCAGYSVKLIIMMYCILCNR